MKTLIKKDIKLVTPLGHLLVFAPLLIYIPLMTPFISMSTKNGSIILFTIISLLSMYSLINMMNKFNSQGEVVLNSLPLEKNKIVLGRYLSLLIYSFIIPTSIYIIYFLFRSNLSIAGSNKLDLSAIIVSTMALLIFNSVHLFFYYNRENESKKLKIILALIFLIIIFIGFRYSKEIFKLEIFKYLESFNIVLLLFFIFSIIIYIISFNISKKTYKKREF